MPENLENGFNPEQDDNSTNNFWCLLPGGAYRDFYGKYPKYTEVMDALDTLLKEEFKEVDAERIIQDKNESNELMEEAFDLDSTKTEDENKAVIKKAGELARKHDVVLHKLYNRLIELGFDEKTLTA